VEIIAAKKNLKIGDMLELPPAAAKASEPKLIHIQNMPLGHPSLLLEQLLAKGPMQAAFAAT